MFTSNNYFYIHFSSYSSLNIHIIKHKYIPGTSHEISKKATRKMLENQLNFVAYQGFSLLIVGLINKVKKF